MPNKEHAHLPQPDEASWDTAAIAGALGVGEPAHLDQRQSRRVRLDIGDPPSLELQVHPDARFVRLESEAFSLSLLNAEPPRLAPSGVIFDARSESGALRLSVMRTGTATLVYEPVQPSETAKSAPAARETVDQATTPSEYQKPVNDDLMDPDEASEVPSPAPASPARKYEQPRVQIAGRLGMDPRFRTTKNGKVIGSFSVAIRQEDGSTQWRDVKVFNERAAALRNQETLKKGMFVEITGYEHERESKGKDGQVRITKEVYGVVVKPR